MKLAVKQRLLAIARRAGALPLLEPVRFALANFESARMNRVFLSRHPNFACPPKWWMHDMYSHTSYERYWRTGRQTAIFVRRRINAHIKLENPRVADWGCGLARVIRHMPKRYVLTGFDYNANAIAWDAAHIPSARFLKNDLMPPLPVEDGSFDALYALSVFTHLSEEGHERWIAEIERVLAPGGVFIGAFHVGAEPGRLLPHEKAKYDAGELVVRAGGKEGSRIYTAHHPEKYVREKLLKNFEILDGPLPLFRQTIFVARKR